MQWFRKILVWFFRFPVSVSTVRVYPVEIPLWTVESAHSLSQIYIQNPLYWKVLQDIKEEKVRQLLGIKGKDCTMEYVEKVAEMRMLTAIMNIAEKAVEIESRLLLEAKKKDPKNIPIPGSLV